MEAVRLRHVVHTVQQADAGVDGPVEVQLLHALAEENGGFPLPFQGFLRSHSQHFRGKVHANHFIAPLGQ